MTPDTRSDRPLDPGSSHPAAGASGVRSASIRTPSGSRLDRLAPEAVPADAGLRRRYAAYRRRQGAALLALVPRAGARSLYSAARDAGVLSGSPGPDDPDENTLAALADFCADLLPLPPYPAWRRDFDRNRAAHLDAGEGFLPDAPVTMELRTFADAEGRAWYASLDVRPSEDGFRGGIVFHRDGGIGPYGTAEVFREESAAGVRERFADFDERTLRAFLRSVLP